MAEAFSDKGRLSYKYQYSVGSALHGLDTLAYFGPSYPTIGPDFEAAFMAIIGNFVRTGNPSISATLANGPSSPDPTAPNPATNWPAYANYAPYQLDLNQTGGAPENFTYYGYINVTENAGPGLVNDITLVNAFTWEAGRGVRCDFWRSVAAIVPE